MSGVPPPTPGQPVGEPIARFRAAIAARLGLQFDDGRAGFLASGSVFLQKPFTGAQLARAIRDVLAS